MSTGYGEDKGITAFKKSCWKNKTLNTHNSLCNETMQEAEKVRCQPQAPDDP